MTEPSDWVAVGAEPDVVKARKVVLTLDDGHQVVVVANDGKFYAFDNICRHKQRELAKGVILNGKLVCPGHQWAFALDTGWEAVKHECQPSYVVEVIDGKVMVDQSSRLERAT